jgi:hypothetical protein
MVVYCLALVKIHLPWLFMIALKENTLSRDMLKDAEKFREVKI